MEPIGNLSGKQIVVGLAKYLRPGEAEDLLKSPIKTQVAPAYVLDFYDGGGIVKDALQTPRKLLKNSFGRLGDYN